MREISHQKGKKFQKSAKSWLINSRLFGYEIADYGDAYDLSRQATCIGGIYFDFSLKLLENSEVRKLAFVECKYRNEFRGNINSEFTRFFKNVFSSLENCNSDEFGNSEFLFISNIPPDTWRTFLNDRISFVTNIIKVQETQKSKVLNRMVECINILILSNKIIKG